MARLKSIGDVVDWRLCLGCGACAYICPEQKISLVNFLEEGIRPVAAEAECASCRKCLDVCPAVQTDFRGAFPESKEQLEVSAKEWGSVVGIWEGHATDPEIRFKGSSGGALTAIGAYCVEKLGMHGVLHIAQDPANPVYNRTQLSRTREQLLAATGSRYSPASVCDGLGLVQQASAPCVVIGKPGEMAAVSNARKLSPELDRKVGVTLSFFCAETPATRGTLAFLKKLGVDPASLGSLKYRGLGWPGHFAPVKSGEANPCQQITYRESWAFLQAFRPWSVQLWPDSTGELADIACGDPWYQEPDGKNPGSSIVVARTARGREIIAGAIAAEYLTLTPAESWKLVKSQSGLIKKKGAVWGRRLALRLMGLPVTRFSGLDLWHCWIRISLNEKLRSTFGTIRRIMTRQLRRPLKLDRGQSVPVKLPFQPPV